MTAVAERAVRTLDVEIVVPVYNEEVDLGPSVRRLHAYLQRQLPVPRVITIADNASTDAHLADRRRAGRRAARRARRPPRRARAAAGRCAPCGRARDARRPRLHGRGPVHRPRRAAAAGRAAALRALRPRDRHPAGPRAPAWCAAPKREFDLALLQPAAARARCAARFSDAQCGFKAIRADVRQALLPLVEDTGWFFDTELLVLAERAGLRIHEVPVDWVDDPDSRRRHRRGPPTPTCRGIAARRPRAGHRRAAAAELRGRSAARAARPVPGVPPGWPRQLLRFAVIGVLSHARLPRCCTSLLRGAARRAGAPTSSRCCSPPSPTPRPTGGSPSASAAARRGRAHQAAGPGRVRRSAWR